MGRRGPAPKPPDQHANPGTAAAERARIRIVDSDPVPCPPLPAFMPGGNEWPEQTLYWWNAWTTDPLTADYRMSDWLDLIDCAVIHGRLWSGDDKAAAELRLRMSKHGATKEDRAKLRITFATQTITENRAEEAESKKPPAPAGQSARERRASMKIVPVPTFTDGDPGF